MNTGTVFTSLTTTVKELVALKAGEPSSVTMVMNVFVLGPCASIGVQLITPVFDMLAFKTGPLAFLTVSEYVSAFAGMSESVAPLVTVRVVNSSMIWSGGDWAKTGAVFTSFTTIVNELVALMDGEPLSVTMVVNVFVLGP